MTPYRDCSTEYRCEECGEHFDCSTGESERARVTALESQLADARGLLAECEEPVDYAVESAVLEPGRTQLINLARRIAAALKGTTTCDS